MRMQDLLEARRAIRTQVCMQCHRRPPGGELLGPEVVRCCENTCEVFDHLPRLLAMVRRFGGEPPCGYRLAIQSLVCAECASDPRACACDQLPLARFASEVLATLESLDEGGRTDG